MPLPQMGEDKHKLVDSAAVRHAGHIGGHLVQAENWRQLIDENDEADGRDEATEERAAQDVVDESKSAQSMMKTEAPAKPTATPAILACKNGIIFAALSDIDVALDYGADEQRAGGLGSNDHLGAAAQKCVNQGVEDEGVQPADGSDMCEILGVGEGHWQIHGSHGDGGGEVAREPRPFVLAHPRQTRDIVGEEHGPRVVYAVLLGQGTRRCHLLALHHLGKGPSPSPGGRRRRGLAQVAEPSEPSNDVLSDSAWNSRKGGLVARGEKVPWLQGPS